VILYAHDDVTALRNVGYGCYNFCVRATGGQETVEGGGS